jgi:hypothetical protein
MFARHLSVMLVGWLTLGVVASVVLTSDDMRVDALCRTPELWITV